MITLKDIRETQDRIAPYVLETPLLRLAEMDEYLGCKVYAKAECHQITGSFKLRGVMNKMLQLTPEQKKKGVIAVSQGKHGKAVAYAAQMLEMDATIIMPDTVIREKVNQIRYLGAEVMLLPRDECFKEARHLIKEKGFTLIPSYNDGEIMAGAGTIGLEIIEQMKDVDKVVVPVSGGGLISGVATAIKELKQGVRIIGAEPALVPAYTVSLREGRATEILQKRTMADALISNMPGDLCYRHVENYVDDIIDVNEKDILRGAKLLLQKGHVMAEFSSSNGIGAVFAGQIFVKPEDKVCFVLSGGSLDLPQLDVLRAI